jgi:hypothetical protein
MIPTFTEEQKKDNLRLAVKALRENPKKAKGQMIDDDGGRCCLCVMAHVAEDICGVERNSFCSILLPTIDLSDVFAVADYASFDVVLGGDAASDWNDGSVGFVEKTHAEIADMIEKEYLASDYDDEIGIPWEE